MRISFQGDSMEDLVSQMVSFLANVHTPTAVVFNGGMPHEGVTKDPEPIIDSNGDEWEDLTPAPKKPKKAAKRAPKNHVAIANEALEIINPDMADMNTVALHSEPISAEDNFKKDAVAFVEAVEEILKEPAPITADDAMAALKIVNSELGLEPARKLLEDFHCVRFSDLKEKDFVKFINRANDLLAKVRVKA
jgi:hypothetical protein